MSAKKTDGDLDDAIRISSAKQRTRSSCACDSGRIENSAHSTHYVPYVCFSHLFISKTVFFSFETESCYLALAGLVPAT